MRKLARAAVCVGALAWAAAARGEDGCPEGEPVADNDVVKRRLAIAEGDVSTEDVARLNGRIGSVQVAVTCLGELITPENAGRYHALRALKADPLGANPMKPDVLASAARAHQLGVAAGVKDPQLSLALPPGHGLARAYGAAPPAATDRVRSPKSGVLAFDGVQGRERPTNAATVFQWLDADSGTTETRYLLPTDPLPPYPVKPVVRTALAAAAASFAVAGAGLFAGARVTEAELSRTNDPSLLGTNYALFGGAVGAGVVSLGLGAGALAVGPR